MARRRDLVLCLIVVAVAVILRGLLFMAPGVRFDADQAVVGLMAKHISEGRAFPLYFYGQNYLLAIEAYLAAPVMWLLGPTEAALKLPVLAMNLVAAALIVWQTVRAGLTPWLALVCALPFAVPPIVVGTRLMEAMGGNIETPFYAVLLWTLRRRPWPFALTAAIAIAHRELVAYPLVVLLLLEIAHARALTRPLIERWAIVGVLGAAVQTALAGVRPFAAMFGPGTVARTMDLDLTSALVVSAQFCLSPSRWPERWDALVDEHLPLMAGGLPGPMQDIGVSSGMGQGNPGLFAWVLALVAVSLAAAWHARPAHPDTAPDDGVPDAAWPWFLMGCGLVSTGVYAFVSCSQLAVSTLRYNLLVVFIPAGAAMLGLRHPSAAVRAGLVTALLIWTAPAVDDYCTLAAEIRSGRWPDYRLDAVRRLEARHLDALWGDYRLAYLLTFRAEERVTVAATLGHRIDLYAERARAAHAATLRSGPCAGGEELVPGVWLCPP